MRPRNFRLLLLSAALFSFAATTQSAKSNRFVAPKTWQMVENKTYHFQFSVPPAWKQTQMSDTSTAYLLPAFADQGADLFLLVVGKSKASTIEALAKETRAQLAKGEHNERIMKDQAANLGDHAAWLFIIDSTEKVKTSINGSAPKDEDRHFRIYRIVSVDNDVHYDLQLHADPNSFDKEMGAVKKVADTFTWTAASTGNE